MNARRFVSCTVAVLATVVVFACSSSQTSDFTGGQDAGMGPGVDGAVGPQHDGSSFPTDSPSFFRDTGGNDAIGQGSDATLFNDAGLPDVGGDGACVAGDAGAPPYKEKCAAGTLNECDGATDSYLSSIGVVASLLNGTGGNGFDDDCDGQVDEGCACASNGLTKPCYLVPPSLVDPATKQPVGWCTQNSLGSLDCAGAEFPHWSGICRGAQPPYPDDICAPGDFNCDGQPENSHTQDCTCHPVTVACPTAPITEAPYPPPTTIRIIDGSQWISDPTARTQTTNWAWTVVGGDCDNVLPHPTYAVYKQTNSTAVGARVGTRTPVKFDNTLNPPRYVAAAGQPLISVQATNYGSGIAGGQVYPAFGLSGDYIVQGEFDLMGQHYVCTQKVQVRAPGIRAELCWDTVGGAGSGAGGNDIDLHFAQLQYNSGAASCSSGQHGFETNCRLGQTYEDCWYNGVSGCRDSSTTPPDWKYADSADSACIGWSSKRTAKSAGASQGCTNPRLDKDNVTCDTTVDDPTNLSSFCGPENINLDNPRDGDAFVVAVNFYDNWGPNSTAHTHVNLYCNGQRAISVGYNPVTGQTSYPALLTPGQDSTGDYSIAGTIKAHVAGGQVTSCDVATIPSHSANVTRDGSTALCVESTQSSVYPYKNHLFDENPTVQIDPTGSIPTQTPHWCKH